MRITVTHDDGTEVDITEGVQIAYDVAYRSDDWDDWGLDADEMDTIARLAEACRFDTAQQALNEARQRRERQERAQQAALESHRRAQEQLAEQAQRQRIQDRGVWLP